MTRLGTALLIALAAQPSCGSSHQEPPRATNSGARIITTERNARGGRLVVIDESGARMDEWTEGDRDPDALPTVDADAAFSPDGRWLVFSSTRDHEKTLQGTSLWILPATSRGLPIRLTQGAQVDRDPTWLDGGKRLLFASNRAGTFDLWTVDIDLAAAGGPRLVSEPSRLTEMPAQEVSPSVSPDGRTVVFMATRGDRGSSLWTVPLAGGDPVQLTEGPTDYTPQWGPKGKIAFAAGSRVNVDGRTKESADLFLMEADGSGRTPLVAEDQADLTGPVWSADGRFLFATAVFWIEGQSKPAISSLVFVDLAEQPAVLRALHDPVYVESRMGVALAPQPLDAERLRKNLPYREALVEAIRKEELRRAGLKEAEAD